jgi:hypothetical protein
MDNPKIKVDSKKNLAKEIEQIKKSIKDLEDMMLILGNKLYDLIDSAKNEDRH